MTATRCCTVGQAAGLICDPQVGKYPFRSASRDELERALALASRVWGADRLWTDIEELDYTKLLNRCPCGIIKRQYDGRTEYWRWEGPDLRRYALPPPHPEKVA